MTPQNKTTKASDNLSKRSNLKSTYYKDYVGRFDLKIKEEIFITTDRYIFKIKRTRRNFLICIKGYEEHSHFNTIQGCGLLIDYIETKTVPYNEYFRVAIIRVIGEKEFSKFDNKSKQRYKDKHVVRK